MAESQYTNTKTDVRSTIVDKHQPRHIEVGGMALGVGTQDGGILGSICVVFGAFLLASALLVIIGLAIPDGGREY